MKTSIVIPVYNEVGTIAEVIGHISHLYPNAEVIVVDDGSTDGTREILEKVVQDNRQHGIQALFHEKNRGKGAAVRTGLDQAVGEIIVIQDADLEYHPEDYPVAVKLIEDGYADAVYGSRFLGPHRCFLFWHYAANKLLTLLCNMLYNTILTDMETGFKVFRADVLRSLDIRSSTFDFEVEVTAKLLKRGYRVYEIPITYTGRRYEEGKKITWKDGFRAVWAIIRYRLAD